MKETLGKVIYIDLDRKQRNTAGAKAPDDIAQLCAMRGYQRFIIPNFPVEKNKIFKKLWLITECVSWWKKLEKTVQFNDVVIYQHPLYGKRIAAKMIKEIQKNRHCKFVVIIHDLESIRGGIAGVISQNKKTDEFGDSELIRCFDAIICHNEHMKNYMIEQGFDKKKLFNLQIFDYISDYTRTTYIKSNKPSIAIAGNLAFGKCAYIYDIYKDNNNKNLEVNLYGSNFEKERGSDNRVKWHGSFKPEELPVQLQCDFGLVWDGSSTDTCEGNTGNYLRYNNPHKTSLYLSAGIPVIVWKYSAIADFVLENGVGLVVENLHNLDKVIQNIDDQTYIKYCKNTIQVAKQLRSGYYFYRALDEILTDFSQGE